MSLKIGYLVRKLYMKHLDTEYAPEAHSFSLHIHVTLLLPHRYLRWATRVCVSAFEEIKPQRPDCGLLHTEWGDHPLAPGSNPQPISLNSTQEGGESGQFKNITYRHEKESGSSPTYP